MPKRTPEEKKEIYSKWKSLINMTQKSLDSWSENEDRLLASINREEAEEAGDIQSGYDSFHRIKRRKSKPFDKWTAQDFDNAAQENGFNSRMIGGKPGQPVGDSGMSKWEISLRNWGHNPSLKSSPAHSKWKSWKMKHSKKANYKKVSDAHMRDLLIVADLMSENKRKASEKDNEEVLLQVTAKYLNEKKRSDVQGKVPASYRKKIVELTKYFFTASKLEAVYDALYKLTSEDLNRHLKTSPNIFKNWIYQEFNNPEEAPLWVSNIKALAKAKTLGEVAGAANMPFEVAKKNLGIENTEVFRDLFTEYLGLKHRLSVTWWATTSLEEAQNIKQKLEKEYKRVLEEEKEKYAGVSSKIKDLELEVELTTDLESKSLAKGRLDEYLRGYEEYKLLKRKSFELHEINNVFVPSSKKQILLIKGIEIYSRIMKGLSYVPDTKMFGLKLALVSAKILAVLLVMGNPLMSGLASVASFIKFIGFILLFTNIKFTASYLRKSGVILGSTSMAVLGSLPDFIGFVVVAAMAVITTPLEWLAWLVKKMISLGMKGWKQVVSFIKRQFKGDKKAALQRIAGRLKKDPSYRRRLKANLNKLYEME